MVVLVLVLIAGIDVSSGAPGGTIQGTVLNGTRGNQPLENAQVLLRAGTEGELVPVAETITDRYGNFVFEQVPLDPSITYLPGANHDEVHYPGRRVRLDSSNQSAHSAIVAYDAVETPCPLVATRHDIEITVEDQALKVTESLRLSNPTRTTFVGQSMGHGPPVTFWLSIPKDFDRVTFEKEFYGRRFIVVDHRPVTEMPWLPGKQEMRFSYRVPLVTGAGKFRRTLDVLSDVVCVRVVGTDRQQISCNLPQSDAADHSSAYVAVGEQLKSGFTVELQIESLPFPWMQYARWTAVALLILSTGATFAIPPLRRRLWESPTHTNRQRSPRRKAAA